VNDNQVLPARCRTVEDVQSGAEGSGNACHHCFRVSGFESA
jgi:hypothetical protein